MPLPTSKVRARGGGGGYARRLVASLLLARALGCLLLQRRSVRLVIAHATGIAVRRTACATAAEVCLGFRLVCIRALGLALALVHVLVATGGHGAADSRAVPLLCLVHGGLQRPLLRRPTQRTAPACTGRLFVSQQLLQVAKVCAADGVVGVSVIPAG